MLIAGVDEAGRGPLVGPVVAAAVILNPTHPIIGLADSKKLSVAKREQLFVEITTKSLAFAIASCSAQEIDELNILNASLLAMQRAIEALAIQPQHVQVDGNRCPKITISVEAIIKGDDKIPAIQAASILAKVTRDREVAQYDALYPGYNFAQHKGYPTSDHLAALERLGVTPLHRRTFGPVKRWLEQNLETI